MLIQGGRNRPHVVAQGWRADGVARAYLAECPTNSRCSEPPLGTPGLMEHGLSCGIHFTEVGWDARFFDVELLTECSTAVVTGTVVDVVGRWATADGSPPVDEEEWIPNVVDVYRVVEVALTGVGKHPPGEDRFEVGSSIQVRTFGGRSAA